MEFWTKSMDLQSKASYSPKNNEFSKENAFYI